MYRRMLRRLLSIVLLFTAATTLAVVPQVTRTPSAFANVGINGTTCGILTNYVAATTSTAGQIVIGNTSYPIAPGTTLSGNPSFLLFSSVCLTATVDALGQIIGGTLSTNSTTNVSVCGVVTAFASPTSTTLGFVTIGGQTYLIAPNNSLGVTSVTLGASYCLNSSLNASSQLVGGTLTPGSVSGVNICGVVTAYTPASAFGAGSITIGGQTFGIAPGVTLSGGSLLAGTANPNLCLQATLNGAGQISAGSVGLTLGGAPTVSVCGMITAYTAATATAGGTITVAGNTLPISAGAVFNGVAQPAAGVAECLTLFVNSSGAIVGGTVVSTTTGIPLSATPVTPHRSGRYLAIPE